MGGAAVKERDHFAAMAIEAIIIERGPQTAEVGKEQHASMAYAYADAMEEERLKRFRWPVVPAGTAVEAGDTTSVVDLSDWPSFSEASQAQAKNQAEKLIMDAVPFHCSHTGDVWVFTVLCEDWETAEEEAYERLVRGLFRATQPPRG